MIIETFQSVPIVGILRGITEEMVAPLAKTCAKSGLPALEITMNTKNAPTLISEMCKAANGNFAVGAGTVLNIQDLNIALKSGATFIVTPTIVPDVIRSCVSQNIPIFPGAFTPTEIQQAWDLGATMVKVFPSSMFGPKYFKEIKGPLNKTKLLACGGVSKDTIADFFANGADGAAFGGSIFKQSWLDEGNYAAIEQAINELIDAFLTTKE